VRTDPELIEIATGERGMIRGIEACIKSECLVSAIALIYASIDSLSALTRPINQEDTTAKEFKDWVNKYLLPQGILTCTAEELYGARCGVLHTQSPDSRIQRQGSGVVKRLIYCWQSGPPADAQKSLPQDATTVIVEDLFEGFKIAVERFLAAIEADPGLSNRVDKNCSDLLCYKPFQVVTIRITAS
jgi:hypothetical protein